MPWSPCGPDCLPPRPERVAPSRVALRLGSASCVLVAGIGLAAVISVVPGRAGQRMIRKWFRALLRAFGVRLVVHGTPRTGGGLVVSNHVSWLDVVAMQAVCPMRLLAKTEVKSWPLIGALAGRAGTLYIDRDRLAGLPAAVGTIAAALREDAVVGAFPEGTTWCGSESGRYRPAVFQAAIDAGAPVRPIALRFRTEDGEATTAAAFVGEATLFESVLAVARLRGLVVELSLLPELDSAAIADRRVLARRAQAAVASATAGASPQRHALAA
ncbi:lysophospholipid acyltransferase family protein [Saccharopolyspora taberi]|uniref:Lysophospholipid acyltransferase family protein n=2 Tax=Saccharopolyspora taberi TaxID=60895 RepID=A0ABN3V5D0_9PSEU